jgi:hypothetical protein
MGVDDYNETIKRIESAFLDAIEGIQHESAPDIVYAGIGLLVRLAHDCAPSEEAAQQLVGMSIDHAWEDVDA